MRVILDTNVLMSGIFFGGIPGRLLHGWAARRLILVLTPAILEEYRRVGEALGSRYPDLMTTFEPVLALLAMNAVFVNARPLEERVTEDPADDMFLAAAIASRTRIIVSGDKHLLRVSGWRGISVLTPRQFADRHL